MKHEKKYFILKDLAIMHNIYSHKFDVIFYIVFFIICFTCLHLIKTHLTQEYNPKQISPRYKES
jgi:hypothetical protein